ncbi:hypothetical protein RHSIM_Rhsim01G0136800 [Rhododendron simsii]|uniref:Uncharacterized protein n=1 Tax=Rhododendron simsii TaxID=118357 RepID=A0A834HJR1_RHOSS|nr:hypothetical protein RHSIM_Rhsim01G0136800 [Rhododendron simsii]
MGPKSFSESVHLRTRSPGSASNSHFVFKIGNKSQTQDYFAPNAASVHPNIPNLNQTLDSFSPYIGSIHPNISNLNQTQKNSTIPTNLTLNDPIKVPTLCDWISAELDPNYTSNLLSGWLSPGGVACNYSKTADISIPGLDSESHIELSTGDIHEFVFQALDEAGKPNCVGSDYFEFDVSGDRWKSRPSLKDFNNGTYSFSLQIHPDFAGYYNLTVVLLFRHYEGLRFSPHRFAVDKELRRKPIKFYKSPMQLPQLTTCSKFDFSFLKEIPFSTPQEDRFLREKNFNVVIRDERELNQIRMHGLYIYDPESALNADNNKNLHLRKDALKTIQDCLLVFHPFPKKLLQAFEILNQSESAGQNLPVYLHYSSSTDRARYNLPTADEIAIILPGDGTEKSGMRDIVLHLRGNNGLMRVNEYHPAYLSLHYVLLFPRGELGWKPEMRYWDVRSK